MTNFRLFQIERAQADDNFKVDGNKEGSSNR